MAERRKFETILIENGLVTDEQLKQIASYAHAVGIDLHEAVLQKKIASSDAVMMAYAESIGLPFVHLADIAVDEEIVAQIDSMTARQYSFVPISLDQGHVLLATTKPVVPDVEQELRMIFNLPVRCVICTPTELSDALTKYYPRGTSRIAKAERSKVPPPQPVVKQPIQKQSEPVKPMNNEERKDRIWKSIIAFNISVALVGFGVNYLQMPKEIYDTWYLFMSFCVVVGGVVALIVWKALSR